MSGIKENNYQNRAVVILIAVLVTFLCMIPCFGSTIPDGVIDMEFHILRVESIYEYLKSGLGLKSYIYSDMLCGYGYANGIFYPDIFLYPAVLFRFLGASPELAMKLFICLCTLATCFTSYLAGKNIGKDRNTGIIVMILYTMGHFHLETIYRRSAIGEVIGMIFIPLAVWALYDLTEYGYKKRGLLFISFTCLMLSHTISFVLAGIMAVVWVIIRIKKVCNKRSITGILLEALACIAVTSFYWIPFAEQMASDKFHAFENPAFYPSDEVMTFLGVLCGRLCVSFAEIGIIVLIIALGAKYKKVSKKSIVFFSAVILLLLVESDLFPWDLIDKTPLVSLQFTWRLNILEEIFAALALACQLKALFGSVMENKKRLYQIISFCILLGIFHLSIVWQVEITDYKNYDDDYFSIAENTTNVGLREWLPDSFSWGETINSDNRGMVETDNGFADGTYNNDGSYVYVIDDGYTGYAEFPKTYYKGYVAIATLNTGEEIELDVYESNKGLVCADIPENTVSVKIWYKETFAQKVSMFISCLSIILILFGLMLYRYKKEIRKYRE